MGDIDYNILVNNLKTTDILICVWWGTYQTSHCSVMEAFLDECEPEEVDRNHPMTLGNATKVCDGYVRGWGIYQRMIVKIIR